MNYRTFKLSDGRTADVPEDQIDYFMRTLDSAGVDFETANVSADMQVGEPEAIKQPMTTVDLSNDPQEHPSLAQRFLDSPIGKFGSGVVDAAGAMGRGFSKGLSYGASDELGAGLNALTGGDYQADAMRNRFLDDKAADTYPLTFGIGRGAGMLPGMFIGGATALGRLGMGALEGALGGAGESNSDDLGQTLEDSGKGALVGLGTAGTLEGGGAVLQKGGQKLRDVGVGQRVRSALDLDPAANEALIDDRGIDYLKKDLPRRFEELGLVDSLKPQSAEDVYRRIGPKSDGGDMPPGLLAKAGAREGAAIDAAEDLGAYGAWDNVQQGINDVAAKQLKRAPEPSLPNQREVGELRRIARDEVPVDRPINADDLMEDVTPGPSLDYSFDRIAGLSKDPTVPANLPPPLPKRDPYADFPEAEIVDEFPITKAGPRDLLKQKREFEDAGYPEGVVSPSEAIQPSAYRKAATPVRSELDDTMQQASPDIYNEFQAGRDDYRDLSALGSLAKKKVAKNEAQGYFGNPWTYAGGAMASGMGLASGNPMLAAGAGLAGGALGRKYGQDAAGAAMQGMGQGMRGLGGAMTGKGQVVGSATAALQEGDSNDAMSGRGYLLSEAAQQLLREDPQSLGQYAQGLAQAWSDPEPSALSTMIIKLSRTDPNFRTQILPALRARTQGEF